ncbi:hypothetical protein BD324DRAFT_252838 [Kockovaella imperatae]|uniref:Uncharacterized protein n=1 Tax=Kockovaella imperatae TaxID=4999 RepID=A0A1Y1UPZ6_9TREE|nr:hypothetical protein BD324DRAFT_252838 [Kockovaella imperatae]ORX40042.1 hypothetical protein BD324DRAFT_252838 [Kockovaella imperatae]
MPAVRPRQYLSRQESGASVRSLPRYSIQAGEQELVLARQSSNLAEELYRQNRIPNSGESADHQLPTGGSIIGSLMRTVTSTSLSRGPAPSYLEATVSSTQGSDVERGTIERVPTNQKEASQPSSGFRRFFTMPRFGGKSQPTQRSTDVPEMTQLAVPRPAVTTTRAHVDSHSQPRNSSQSLLLRPLDSRHSTDSSGSHGRHSTIGGSPSFRTSYDAPRAGFTPDQMRFLSAHEGIDLTRVHIGAQESGGARIPPPRFEEVESNGSRGVEVVTGASEGEGSPVAPVRTLLASRGQAERGESGGRESRPQ